MLHRRAGAAVRRPACVLAVATTGALAAALLVAPTASASPSGRATTTRPAATAVSVAPSLVPLGRVVAPGKDALVVARGGVVLLRLSAVRGATVSRVVVNGRDVTRLVAQSGTAASVRLRLGAGLTAGRNAVLVRFDRSGRRSLASTTFVVTRSARGLVDVLAPAPGAALRGGPLAVRLRVEPRATMSAWLNGVPVTARFAAAGKGLQTASLPPGAGLRHGANVLRVRAVSPSGRLQTAVRRVVVARGAPLSDAGADLRASTGRAVRLDGRASRAPAGSAAGLAHAWTVVSGPRGATPLLLGARSTRPVLRAAVAGRYVLRHTVTTVGARPAGDAPSSRASGSDLVTITASVPGTTAQIQAVSGAGGAAATGVAASSGPGLQVGGTIYPSSIAGPGIQVVVLDRTSLALVSNTSYAPGSMTTFAFAMQNVVQAGTDANPLVLISTLPGGSPTPTPTDEQWLESGLASLGPAEGLDVTMPFGFAAVPTTGQLSAGSTWFSGGALSGWATLVTGASSTLWSFGWGDYAGADSRVPNPGAGIANRVAVGSTTYDVPTSAVTTGGFQVVSLDPQTLVGTSAYFELPGQASALAAALLQATVTGRALVVTSIGALPALLSPDSGIAGDLQTAVSALVTYGATADVLLGIGPSDVYSFVGPTQPGQNPAEAGTPVPGASSGRVTAQLSRQSQGGGFAPLAADVTGQASFASSLSAAVYQPTTPWPYSTSRGGRAAVSWISGQVQLGCDASGQCNARNAYADVTTDVAGRTTEVAALRYPRCVSGAGSTCREPDFSRSTFEAVQKQLITEFTDVGTVWTYIGAVQAIYTDTGGETITALSEIITTITDAVTPQNTSITMTVLSFLTDFLWAASLIEAPGFAAIASAAGQLAVAAATANDVASLHAGTPLAEVQALAPQLQSGIEQQITGTFFGLGAMGQAAVQDAARLVAVAEGASGAWGFTATQSAELSELVTVGAAQNLYGGLMPAAYVPWALHPIPGGTNPAAACNTEQKGGRFPWQYMDVTGSLVHRMPLPAAPAPLTVLEALYERGKKPAGEFALLHHAPPPSLTEAMFATASAGTAAAGLYAPWYWNRTFFVPDLVAGSVTCEQIT